MHLGKVLKLLRENQLYINRKKCMFEQGQLEYLGHIISAKGVSRAIIGDLLRDMAK